MAILFGPVFFRPAFPCSGGYHLERRGMPLHDAVGINCKTDTTKTQGAVDKYMGEGVYVDDCMCVLSDLTTPPWWRKKVMVYYYYYYYV